MKINQIHRRALSLLLSFTLVLGIFGVDVGGAFAVQANAQTTLFLDSGDISISDSGNYLITQTDSGNSTRHTITVTGGAPEITLRNVNIDVSGTGGCAFSIAAGASVTLTLTGKSTLKSGSNHAGVQVPGDAAHPNDPTKSASLIITDTDDGSLTAYGIGSAGIGGGWGSDGGKITIAGGTVTAHGDGGGAGIGGGERNGATGGGGGNGGNIAISGGTVTAYGVGGAGIGGGGDGSGGNITINGGTVTAYGYYGAGIGGGDDGSGGSITINGGTVTANGGVTAAGIGGGDGGSGGNITMNGGTVTAGGGDAAAGIGGGDQGNGGTIIINGGIIAAIGGTGQPYLDARGGSSGAGIGGGSHGGLTGYGGTGGSVAIHGGAVTAQGGRYGAGIGGGDYGAGGTVTIDGGVISANGTDCGAGIGGGINGDGGTVAIRGGMVSATGGAGGAGIGGGNNGDGGTVTISGSGTQVTANGQSDGNDIGSGVGINLNSGSLTVGDGSSVEPLPLLALLSTGTNANSPTYKNCRIITGGAGNQAEGVYSAEGGRSSGPAPVTASLTAKPASDSEVTLSTSVKDQSNRPVTSGTLSFSYISAKDSGPIPDVDSVAAGADDSWDLPTNGPVLVTAQYTDSSHPYDTMKTSFFYNPQPIDLSTFSSTGLGYTFPVSQNGWYEVTGGTASTPAPIHIDIAGGVTAFLTLSDTVITPPNPTYTQNGLVNITPSSAVSVASGAAATLILKGANILTGVADRAGIYVPDGASLSVTGSGSLTAIGGGRSAGIGGSHKTNLGSEIDGSDANAGSIAIDGGSVTATGGIGGAGIGGGTAGSGGAVSVSGAGTLVTVAGTGGGKDVGSGTGGDRGGTLVVSGADEDHGASVKFQSGGTNAAKPTESTYQFTNCEIIGDFATGADGGDISGWYGADGKIRLSALVSAVPKNAASTSLGNPVTLTAHITRYRFGDIPVLSGKLSFLCDEGTAIVSNVSISGGTASADWTPADTAEHTLTAQYVSTSSDRYALNTKDIIIARYSAGKATPIITAPTASKITSGSTLSSSTLSGGNAKRADGTEIPGEFAWAQPNLTLTTSGSYQVHFTPDDVVNYNTASVMVPVTVEEQPTPTESRHFSSTTSLPSSITDTASGFQIDLSGVTLPPGVTKVTFSASPAAPNSADDPNAASAFRIAITQENLNVIGIPFIYNIRLLDQNGNPITGFSGRVKVKVLIPAGLHGTPHVFRYEESSGTLTDMNAVVENGFLLFETDHFSCYAIAGTGDSITLDTKSYQMPVNGSYQIGVKLTGNKAATLKVTSTNEEVVSEVKLKNGNVQVTGKGIGTAYIMFDVYDSKNKLLTHASVRIDVKTGIRPRGDSTRQTGLF